METMFVGYHNSQTDNYTSFTVLPSVPVNVCTSHPRGEYYCQMKGGHMASTKQSATIELVGLREKVRKLSTCPETALSLLIQDMWIV